MTGKNYTLQTFLHGEIMRIAFVTNNYTPYSGGVVSSINAVVHGLHGAGHDILIIAPDFLGKRHHDPDYVIRVPTIYRFIYKKNHMAIPWRANTFVLDSIKAYNPDVVHVHHPFLLGASGLYAAQKIDVPCVFTYHSLYHDFYEHYTPSFFPVPTCMVKPFISSWVAHFCRSVDGVIAPSGFIKEYIRSQGVTIPIEVIPSSLQPLFMSQNGTQELSNASKDFFELLVVSRFAKEKNLPFVFEVLAQLPRCVRLTLVGYGAEYEFLQQLAYITHGFSQERVRFIHKPSAQDLLRWYQSADLFLFSSYLDTQGLVMVEAMSQGLPVIALDGPGQRDIVSNGMNGYMVSGVEDAVAVISNIIKNDTLYSLLKEGALRTAQRYHPNVQLQQLFTFYDNIMTYER